MTSTVDTFDITKTDNVVVVTTKASQEIAAMAIAVLELDNKLGTNTSVMTISRTIVIKSLSAKLMKIRRTANNTSKTTSTIIRPTYTKNVTTPTTMCDRTTTTKVKLVTIVMITTTNTSRNEVTKNISTTTLVRVFTL